MEKGRVGGRQSKFATGTYEIMGVSKVVAEGARGQFHNFRDVPKTSVLNMGRDNQEIRQSTRPDPLGWKGIIRKLCQMSKTDTESLHDEPY